MSSADRSNLLDIKGGNMGVKVAEPAGAQCRPAFPPAVLDGGFTLIELITAMVMAGILMATAGLAWTAYSKAQAEKSTANDVIATMRDTAQRAQAEGRVYCIAFDPDSADPAHSVSWSIWRYSCNGGWTGTSMQGQTITASTVGHGTAYGAAFIDLGTSSLDTPTLAGTNLDTTCPGNAHNCAYFYPRGISSHGKLNIGRAGSSKIYAVKLEGLTSRAYLG